MADTELARVRAELRKARRQLAALQDRLTDAQTASEGSYRIAYDTTGGPHFDPAQPFGLPATQIAGAAA